VDAHFQNKVEQLLDTAVFVGQLRVSAGAEDVRRWLLFFHEVPNVHVRPQGHHKASAFVLRLAHLERVGNVIRLLVFIFGFLQRHLFKDALLLKNTVDILFDVAVVADVLLLFEAFEHDLVFDILQDVLVDVAQRLCTIEPDVLVLFLLLVVLLPNPGAAVFFQLLFKFGLQSLLLQHCWVHFLFFGLRSIAVAVLILGCLALSLLLGSLLCLCLSLVLAEVLFQSGIFFRLLFLVKDLLVVDVFDAQHCVIGG